MKISELKNYISSNEFDEIVLKYYCTSDKSDIADERERYLKLIDKAYELYGDGDYHIISSPGRTEIGGNHTDHQKGFVIASSINIDNLCIVKKSDDMVASFYDDVFLMNEVNLNDLSIHEEEKNNTKSIIRGTAARYKELSYNIGGFKACQDMRVLVGSGLSSSACFEILITEIYNYLYNDDKVDSVDRAIISQYVENNYFGKPCGLMDQMAISVGGFVSMDFYDEKPKIEKNIFRFGDFGYQLLIINSRADHANLTSEYAAIPNEMKLVAKYFGKDHLSRVDKNEFYKNLKELRKVVSNDRAILRAHHYFNETERARKLNEAIENQDIVDIIKLMNESGNSSYKYLQNVYDSHDTKKEAVALALALSEKYACGDGVVRVQGGGFAGTIQAIVRIDKKADFTKDIEAVFGEGSVIPVEIRDFGTCLVI
ncbi:MAG: galactokinase [Lachnospiraceae bacterium]|nr:galactokinase [Lachnospiraceae bacterium]